MLPQDGCIFLTGLEKIVCARKKGRVLQTRPSVFFIYHR